MKWTWFRRRYWERQMDAEFQFHLETQISDYVRQGLTREAAEMRARREFGSTLRAKDECRDQRVFEPVDQLWHDLRHGVRLLVRNKGFTAVATCALALGIGPNTAIFSLVWAILLAPLPYPQANRLVVVWTKIRGERSGSSVADYLAYRDQNRTFAHLDLTAWNELHLTNHDGSGGLIAGHPVTPGLWSKYLGQKMILGRDFLPEEAKAGNDHEVILNYRLWQEHFDRDPNIIGKQILIDAQPYTVVGVLAKGPQDRGDGGQFTIPLALTGANERQYWGNIFGRLKAGVTLAQAQADLSTINRRLAPTRPSNLPKDVWTVSIEPLKNDWLSQNLARNLWLLLAAVGFILLIACANVASLLLAKGAARQRRRPPQLAPRVVKCLRNL